MKLMTETEYAMYKGDKFIDLGTEELKQASLKKVKN